jgi:hypothetical protein
MFVLSTEFLQLVLLHDAIYFLFLIEFFLFFIWELLFTSFYGTLHLEQKVMNYNPFAIHFSN